MHDNKSRFQLTTGQKLLRNLLLIAAIGTVLWIMADRPMFSVQQAINYTERLQLLEESTLLFHHDDNRYGYSFAAGVTDSHFHLTKLWGGPALWERASERVYSFPLERDLPLMLLSDNYAPPDAEKEQSYFSAAAYCPGAVSGKATLSSPAVESITAAHIESTAFLCENGVFLFFLPKPEVFHSGMGEYEMLYFTMFSGRNPVSVPITLTAELYDQSGKLFAQSSRVYPAQ